MKALLLLWSLAARAGDELGDIEIDLGSSDATPLTYSGGFGTRSDAKIARDAPVTVTVPVGTTSVHCTDTEYVEARVDYILSGVDGAALEAWGKSFKATAWSGSTGGAKVVVGTRPASVKHAKVAVVVNVPKAAKLTISSSQEWIKVVGCEGTVTATAPKAGVYVGGPLKGFTVQAGNGDITIDVEGDSKLTAASSASATAGNIVLTMPLSQDVKFDARGRSVSVAHTVIGAVAESAATGNIGAGGPALTLKASGQITVKTP